MGRGSVGFKGLHGIYHVDVIIDHRQEITKYNSPNQNLFITQNIFTSGHVTITSSPGNLALYI